MTDISITGPGGSFNLQATVSPNTNPQIAPATTQTGTIAGYLPGAVQPITPQIVDWSAILNKPLFGTAALVNTGVGATQAVLGADGRLSDARTPLAHTQVVSTISDSGTIGRQLVQSVTVADVQTLLGTPTSLPVPISQGGTGASTAPAARTNLGSTAVGDALFVAASAAAARTTLGAGAVGSSVFQAITQSIARGALGSGVTGDTLFLSASAAAARSTLGSGTVGDSIFLQNTPQAVRDILVVASVPVFQCRVDLVSASIVRLTRINGSYIFINGLFQVVPLAGVDLSPAGLTQFNTYNIFAFWNGSAIQLEASLTARVVDATFGHQVKSGDSTRSFVGKAYVQPGPVWDVNNPLLTVSYYGRVQRTISLKLATTTGTLNFTTPTVVLSGVYNLTFGEGTIFSTANVIQQQFSGGVVNFSDCILRNSAGTATVASATSYAQAANPSSYLNSTSIVSFTNNESLGPNTGTLAYNEMAFRAWSNGGTYQVLNGSEVTATIWA